MQYNTRSRMAVEQIRGALPRERSILSQSRIKTLVCCYVINLLIIFPWMYYSRGTISSISPLPPQRSISFNGYPTASLNFNVNVWFHRKRFCLKIGTALTEPIVPILVGVDLRGSLQSSLIYTNGVFKDMPPAGTPSMRHDLPRPAVPPDGCRADLVHLGADTSANTLLSPSIYSNYGLSFRDFFMPRSSKTIRTLFEKIGYTFPGDTFEKLWKTGVELDKTGCVCVDTFKTLLRTHCPTPKLSVDEQECEKFF